jgi:hypothetical protein
LDGKSHILACGLRFKEVDSSRLVKHEYFQNVWRIRPEIPKQPRIRLGLPSLDNLKKLPFEQVIFMTFIKKT